MKFVWSPEAVADYQNNIVFLLEEWSPVKFISRVDQCLNLIAENPRLYPATEMKNIRNAVVAKQISLFYLLESDRIILVRFWNNYQNPERLKL